MHPLPPQPQEMLSSTPSFRVISDEGWPAFGESDRKIPFAGSPGRIPAVDPPHGVQEAGRTTPLEVDNGRDDDDGGYSSDEFEFAVFSRDSFEGRLEPISADEIFSNGQIRPIYPLFNRALLLEDDEAGQRPSADAAGEAEKTVRLPLGQLMREDREPPTTSSSSAAPPPSEGDDLEGVPEDSYCLWRPASVPQSPKMSRRSHSAGDTSRRWRLRDLVIGRSQSDGRRKFLFLAAPPPQPSSVETPRSPWNEGGRRSATAEGIPAAGWAAEADEKKKKKAANGKRNGGVKVREMDMVTAHRLYYGKGGAATGDRRRSFLPYRKVGLFANVNEAGGGVHHF